MFAAFTLILAHVFCVAGYVLAGWLLCAGHNGAAAVAYVGQFALALFVHSAFQEGA